ncbi:unnamed protein product [Fusarium graminearum]|uniref:Chromosome 1, complete genome n=1 Tax=Gibberella zeae (strain ATCC MYA-4620 / CBS 123657 / FGSC 9075 / NRRL 31084 / PH-1) TaxID=229533 RepID=A0A098D5Y1_GIBZE|nr:unnamed protein product [Fusarium graminearum]
MEGGPTSAIRCLVCEDKELFERHI